MKYFFVLLLVFVVFWLWSHNRRIEKKQADDGNCGLRCLPSSSATV